MTERLEMGMETLKQDKEGAYILEPLDDDVAPATVRFDSDGSIRACYPDSGFKVIFDPNEVKQLQRLLNERYPLDALSQI